jgi:hypothetical protein
MKYKSAVVALAILGAVVIGDGLLKSRHVEQSASKLRAAVAALSIQQLAVSIVDCDAQHRQGERRAHEAAFCEEVRRRLDTEPLQSVEIAAPDSKTPR